MFNRGRIKFFTRTKSFSDFFLSLLFILTFLLIFFNKTDYVIVKSIKSVGIDVISPATKILSMPFIAVTNATKAFNDVRFLKQENLKLKEEIKRLKKWQIIALKNQRENNAYKKLLNSTNSNLNIIKTASVVTKSPGLYSKTIVINAGIADGVSEDLAVINERGLIGKIISSTNKNSKIILINDQNSSVPVRTLSNKYFAIIKGTSDGKYLTSSFIKDEKKPQLGDLLLTSGSAKTFPQDILVGKVIKVNKNGFLALPYVDFDNLDFVQIIENF